MATKEFKQRLFEVVSDEPFLTKEKIIEGLKNLETENEKTGNKPLKDYLYILHDKDTYTEERIKELQSKYPDNEQYKKLKVGDKRPAHWHVYLRFNYPVTFDFIASAFGVSTSCIEKVVSRFANCINYATHNTEEAKKENKYHYNDDEVVANFLWKKEREIAINEEHKKNRKNEIIKSIGDGTIRKFNYYEYITIEEYNTYKKDIDNAFNYREDMIKGVNRDMECIFISGNAGSGKTTYAKRYADSKGYSAYISSGSNDVLDDYRGQDCLILDDLRPSCMGLSDLLKMLDNHTNSTVKSRYRNKSLQECRLIIITSVLSLEEFFKNVFTEQTEPVKQLQRRCTTKIKMDNQFLYISFYDEEKENYTEERKVKNPYANIYKRVTYKTDEEINNRTKDFLIDGMDFVEEDNNIDNQLITDSIPKKIKTQEKIYIADDTKIYDKGLNNKTGKIDYYIDINGIEIKLHEDKRKGEYFYFEK